MGAKQVDSPDNGHTAKTYGNPLGVECEACGRRALVPLDRLGNLDGDVSLWLFEKRAEADAWAKKSGPGF